jgi:type II secretory pathway predicted ATPase ExeA/outer membrane protein OmpA-like peptidoglycan-associated protein
MTNLDRCPVQTQTSENSVQNQLFVHFGLRENPFGGTPDPRFLFHSETHREALASLMNGIDCEFGFQVLVAQPGMGKTTLLFNFLEGYRDTAHTAFLFQPQLAPHELLQSLLLELGAASEDTSVRKLSEQINQVVSRAAQEHKRVIVVVDEAQNLDFPVLETLRQLSNFETPRAKLMQIVLAGQPELVKKLAAPEQEQLRQRISTISRLSPLTFNETRAYINHRLRTAGYKGSEIFTLGAARQIWENGKGVPRKINTLCFNAMLLGLAGNAKSIDEAILEEATRDLDMPSVLADIYRTEQSPLAGVHRIGIGRVQPMRETKPPAGEDVKPSSLSARDNSMQKAEVAPGSSASGNRNHNGENIPLALVEAIVRISKTLEEQKVLLTTKSAPAAESRPGANSVPAPVIAPSTSAMSPTANKTTVNLFAGNQAGVLGTLAASGRNAATPVRNAAPTNADKATALKAGKDTMPAEPKPVTSKALPNVEVTVKQGASAKPGTPSHLTPATKSPAKSAAKSSANTAADSLAITSYLSETKKPSEAAGFWLKALALAAITGILTFVVVEKSLSQHPAQANSSETSSPVGEQGDSSSGFSISHRPAGSAADAPARPSKDTATNSHPRRESRSYEFDDVTVRKFSTENAVTADGPGGTQDSRAIFFDQDSDVIHERYRFELQEIADQLARDPQASAIIEGHTDDSGPEAYNLDLSSRRAVAVRQALINEFNVPGTQLTAIGSGSAGPVRPNSSAEGRAHNRRAAVRLVRLGE